MAEDHGYKPVGECKILKRFIPLQSGKGELAASYPELQATDPIAFPEGTKTVGRAIIQLPKNDYGYSIYARALAKPVDDPTLQKMVITPDLVTVQDEYGNDLVLLGEVGFNFFETIYGINTISRFKGKSTAFPITPIFEWTGTICYSCGIDTNEDGIPDSFVPPSGGTCPVGYVPTDCTTYDGEWVFNIADFVEYLWGLDNTGVKLIQVRFYPN